MVKICGEGSRRSSRQIRRTCQTFQPGTKDRWVVATVIGPAGPSTTAASMTRGSSRIRVSRVLAPGTATTERIGADGSRRTCHDNTGSRVMRATPYAGSSRR